MISSEGEQAWCASLGEPRNGVQSNRTTHDGGKTGKEVFTCYQKLCFLSQLWLPDADISRELLTSKAENKAAKSTEPQQYPLLGKIAK